MIQLRELQMHLRCLIDLVNSFSHQKTLFLKSIISFQKQNPKVLQLTFLYMITAQNAIRKKLKELNLSFIICKSNKTTDSFP